VDIYAESIWKEGAKYVEFCFADSEFLYKKWDYVRGKWE
jgi:hypothetical protein